MILFLDVVVLWWYAQVRDVKETEFFIVEIHRARHGHGLSEVECNSAVIKASVMYILGFACDERRVEVCERKMVSGSESSTLAPMVSVRTS